MQQHECHQKKLFWAKKDTKDHVHYNSTYETVELTKLGSRKQSSDIGQGVGDWLQRL